jgi:diguanylate cyclase (GGDEF)-like protein
MKQTAATARIPDPDQTECVWRFDPVPKEAAREIEPRTDASGSHTTSGWEADLTNTANAGCTALHMMRKWKRTVRDWLRPRLQRFGRSTPDFDEVVYRFSSALEVVASPEMVETALIKQLRRMLPDCRIELLPLATASADLKPDEFNSGARIGESSPRRWKGSPGSSLLELLLRCGHTNYGVLRILPAFNRRSPLTGKMALRLRAICMLATLALKGLRGRPEWFACEASLAELDSFLPADAPHDLTATSSVGLKTTVLNDATFLYAVLPFALAQAQRHCEPLSIVCVEIDRLSGVQELLGRAAAERVVRVVGDLVARMIRRSDVVGKLDDDRIIAVLPRATGDGSLQLAQNLCRRVAEQTHLICDEPDLTATVSIGVATFPTCAHDLYSLFDAADEALALAQNQGRNQAVLAPARICQESPSFACPG